MENNKKIRKEIVEIVSNFIQKNNLDYKTTWKQIYSYYEEVHKIPVLTWYKFGSESKLSFLEDYEELYKTLSKLHTLIKELR